MTPWTMQEKAMLKDLYGRGISAVEIAKKINRPIPATKYQVTKLGLARHKLSGMKWGNASSVQKPPVVIQELKAPFKTLDISILDLNSNTCHSVTGPDAYCGHQTIDKPHSKGKSPYCEWHHKRYYTRSLKGNYNG